MVVYAFCTMPRPYPILSKNWTTLYYSPKNSHTKILRKNEVCAILGVGGLDMFKWISDSKLPRLIKWLLYVVLVLSCVYWIGWFVFKILNGTRKLIHWITEARNWWTFIVCLLIVAIGVFLAAQFYFGLDPIGKLQAWFLENIQKLRYWLGDLISGV